MKEIQFTAEELKTLKLAMHDYIRNSELVYAKFDIKAVETMRHHANIGEKINNALETI